MTIFSFREGLEKLYHHWNEEVFVPQLETHDYDVKVLFGELYLYGCFLNLNMTQRISGCNVVPPLSSAGIAARVSQKLNYTNLLRHCEARLSMDSEIQRLNQFVINGFKTVLLMVDQ